MRIYIHVLIIPREILADIFEHSQLAYPEECCGILVGLDTEGDRTITASHRARNVIEERRHERYLIDERKLIEVTRSTRNFPADIIGFYHSHPDYPSHPSLYDTETAAWPGYSYLIVSLEKDRIASFQSWIMREEGDPFVEERIRISETIST